MVCGGGTPSAWDLNCGVGPSADPAGRANYKGVCSDPRKPTTAIVYVDMHNAARARDAAQTLDVTLSAHVNGDAESSDHEADDQPTGGPHAMGDGRRAFGLLLRHELQRAAAWLAVAVLNGKPLDLEATVNLPVGAGFGALASARSRCCPPGRTARATTASGSTACQCSTTSPT